ncbi:MAG: hypothetical protein SV377_02900 [Halobacteria archaeon]|nr:hypothetical protein [Halobacteria archaeon]
MDNPIDYENPSWKAAFSTIVSYGVLLLILFVALFVIPYLIFLLL